MSADITVLSWNLNAFTSGRTAEKIELLRRLDWDVACLQELLPGSLAELEAAFPGGELATRGFNHEWPKPALRRRCAVLIRERRLYQGTVEIPCGGTLGIDDVESPAPSEILAAAQIEIDGRALVVVSAHPPHSASWQKPGERWRLIGKLRTYAALRAFLLANRPVIVGMDSNAWLDHERDASDPDDGQDLVREFFRDGGVIGVHDALRAWLADHPDELAEIRLRRPRGPLAVTHVTGANHTHAERFDTVLVPTTARVLAIEHNYEDAVAAGSDHAYVRATIQLL